MDQRQHERVAADPAEISVDLMFANEASIVNISLGGISVHMDKGLKIDKEYTIKLKMNGRIVPVKATVAWCRLCRSRNESNGDVTPIYKMGFRFRDVPEGDVEEIVEFARSKGEAVSGGSGPDCDPGDISSMEGKELFQALARMLEGENKVFAVVEGE
ncbi:MAG: PilZ domain-containing protein [Nitrospirota bacterium]